MDISFEFHWNMTLTYSWIHWRMNLLVQSMSPRAVKTALFRYTTSSWLLCHPQNPKLVTMFRGLCPPQNPKLVTTFRGLWYVDSVLSLYVQQSKSCDLSHHILDCVFVGALWNTVEHDMIWRLQPHLKLRPSGWCQFALQDIHD